jgi:hypothetical protein
MFTTRSHSHLRKTGYSNWLVKIHSSWLIIDPIYLLSSNILLKFRVLTLV